jgi:hypothetical protein
MLYLALTALAFGHGPPASATGLAAQDEGPSVVRLTEGLATRGLDGWRYLCPAVWGGTPDAPMMAPVDAGSWLPGAFDLYWLEPDGSLTGSGVSELASAEVMGLAATESHAVALRMTGAQRELWTLGPEPEALWVSAKHWTGVGLTSTHALLTAIEDESLVLASVDLADGSVVEEVVEDDARYTPDVRIAGDVLFVARRSVGFHSLAWVTDDGATTVAESDSEILGPIAHAGAVVAVVDGQLHRWEDSTLAPWGAQDLSCIASVGGDLYGCLFPDLHLLDETGQVGELAFELAALQPPNFEELDPAIEGACTSEWLRMAADLGIDPGLEREEEPEDTGAAPSKDKGCGCAGGGSGGGTWFPIVLLGLRRRSSKGR